MTAVLIVAACWLAPTALIGLWILADRHLDARWDDEQPREVADPAWIAELIEPTPAEEFAEERRASLRAHPSAKRVLDLIAENEAARISEEWEAMNR